MIGAFSGIMRPIPYGEFILVGACSSVRRSFPTLLDLTKDKFCLFGVNRMIFRFTSRAKGEPPTLISALEVMTPLAEFFNLMLMAG